MGTMLTRLRLAWRVFWLRPFEDVVLGPYRPVFRARQGLDCDNSMWPYRGLSNSCQSKKPAQFCWGQRKGTFKIEENAYDCICEDCARELLRDAQEGEKHYG